jgi:DNA-binding CsgD family transcriptional regulator
VAPTVDGFVGAVSLEHYPGRGGPFPESESMDEISDRAAESACAAATQERQTSPCVEWRAISGTLYEVSDRGMVRHRVTGRQRRLWDGGGTEYARVRLVMENGDYKTFAVHVLVATAFLGERPACVVDHIDGVKSNNCVANLQWVSQRENLLLHAQRGFVRARWPAAGTGRTLPTAPPVAEPRWRSEREPVWREVDHRYEVSDDGQLRNRMTGHTRRPGPARDGYCRTVLCHDGKRTSVYVHILVARAFLGPKALNHDDVHHIDGNKANNRAENLRWVSRSENLNSLHQSGYVAPRAFGERNAKMMEMVSQGMSQRKIARHFGISQAAVAQSLRRERSGKWRAAKAAPASHQPRVRYFVRWLKSHPYLYERTYKGVKSAGRPLYNDRYLGRVDDDIARVWEARGDRTFAPALARPANSSAPYTARAGRPESSKDPQK